MKSPQNSNTDGGTSSQLHNGFGQTFDNCSIQSEYEINLPSSPNIIVMKRTQYLKLK